MEGNEVSPRSNVNVDIPKACINKDCKKERTAKR
jgi:hypothetical protein